MDPKIMVIEDEIVVAMEIEEKLGAMGYDVVCVCSTGETALSEIEEKVPDLVLMDIKLDGELDGIQTAELIRRRHDVPVVYLTAYADEGTLDRAKLTEPFGYLVKPFSEVELRTTIEVALYKHRQDMKTRDAAHWFSSAINILGAALMVTDQDGNVKHMNHVAEALTGWSQQEAEGRHFAEVFVIRDPETGEIMENPASMPLTVGFMSGSSRNVLISRKETEIDVENALLPITDSEGRFSGVIIAFQEVTSHDPEDQEWFNHAANLYLLATLSCSEGEFSKAESLYKRTLLLFERHLGTDHPKVTNIINDLEDLYRKTGRKTEADQLKKRVSGLRRGASSGIWAVPHDES